MTTAMKKGGHRKLDYGVIFNSCKDFLCPTETKIQEWFPTELQARLRAHALDPYGLMIPHCEHHSVRFQCLDENCHAKLIIRKVDPDPEGNTYGMYGCMSHQHPLTRRKNSEIVFKNKAEAIYFFNQNFKKKYTLSCSQVQKGGTLDYRNYKCRRKNLRSYGKVNCESRFSIIQTMPRVKDHLQGDERPHSLKGNFYHCHKDEEKFDRDEFGGFSTCDSAKKKYYLRVKNGKVFPLRARVKYTAEEVLEAQRKGFPLTVDDIKT